jgi:hypothetical protein
MVLFIHGAPGSWYDYVKYFGDSTLNTKSAFGALDRQVTEALKLENQLHRLKNRLN